MTYFGAGAARVAFRDTHFVHTSYLYSRAHHYLDQLYTTLVLCIGTAAFYILPNSTFAFSILYESDPDRRTLT